VDVQSPVKLTPDQSKGIQKALTTIPGSLSKTDEATFSKLSALVTVAAGKGLVSSEDVTALTNGLKALADKHPKAEKQLGLTALANTVAPVQKPAVAATDPASGGSVTQPIANASPTGNVVPGNPMAKEQVGKAPEAPQKQEKLQVMRTQEMRPTDRDAKPAVHLDSKPVPQAMRADPKPKPQAAAPKPNLAASSTAQARPLAAPPPPQPPPHR
jgi:hypothetical protein